MVGRDDEYSEQTAAERRAAERHGNFIVGILLLAIAAAVLYPFISGDPDYDENLYLFGFLLLCGILAGAEALWRRLRRG